MAEEQNNYEAAYASDAVVETAAEASAPEATPVAETYVVEEVSGASPAPAPLYPATETDNTLRLIAFVFNVITTVACGILIIPLAWMIPMTVRSWGIYKGTKPNTVAYAVCDLLFINMLSGILLLCSTKVEK